MKYYSCPEYHTFSLYTIRLQDRIKSCPSIVQNLSYHRSPLKHSVVGYNMSNSHLTKYLNLQDYLIMWLFMLELLSLARASRP